jgi:hypothetical protein
MLHKTWMSLGHPPESEKCGFTCPLVEQVQQQMGITLDSAFLGIPIACSNLVAESAYMVIVF